MIKKKTLLYYLSLGLILCGAILLPLLLPGYVFSVDQAFSAHPWMPVIGDHLAIFGLVSQTIGYIIPMWIYEKLIIFGVFFGSFLGGYFLILKSRDGAKWWSIYFSSILLIFNPFLYDRFMDGQINIYISYAFWIYWIVMLRKLFSETSWSNIIFTGVLSVILIGTSTHNTIIILVSLVIFSLVYFFGFDNRWKFSKSIASLGMVILIFNSYLLLPFFFEREMTFGLLQQIDGFGQDNLQVFKTFGGNVGVYLNTLSLHGYWGEGMHRFAPSYIDNPQWILSFGLIFFIVLLGVFHFFRKKSTDTNEYLFGISLLVLGCTSYMLGLGVGEHIFSPFNQFLYDHFSIYKGFREPQKWIGFVVITYAYFGAKGIELVEEFLEGRKKKIGAVLMNTILFMLVLLPIFYTPAPLGGFQGQLHSTEYPKEWKDMKVFLEEKNISNITEDCASKGAKLSNECYSIIVLPWHSYIPIKWTQKKTGVWITQYFGEHLLMGDNMEIGNIYTQSVRPESKIIERYVGPKGVFIDGVNKSEADSFMQDLRGLGIRYILILKESDYKQYDDWMRQIEKMEKITTEKDDDKLKLYMIH